MFKALKGRRRDVMKTGTAWFLFGSIILVFLFSVRPQRHEGFGQGGMAAYVNSVGISKRQVSRLVESARQNARGGDDGEPDGEQGKQRNATALSQLVTQELIAQASSSARVGVSDLEIRDFLVKQPAFQENGQFKREFYSRYLQATGMTATDLENSVRRDLLVQKIQRAFGSALRPTDLEVKKQRELGETKVNLEYLTLPVQGGGPASVSAADAADFAKASEPRVKGYFAAHQPEFAQAEQVHARHILVKFTAGKIDSIESALAKAKQLKARLAKGEGFAAVAKAESDDPGSKASGGDLGFFGRGRMVPEFERVAFEAAPKVVSDPIKTEYGYHLIEVLEKRPAKPAELDVATKDAIARTLLAEDRAGALIDRFQEALKAGDRGKVEGLVLSKNLKWEETGAFSVEATAVPKIGPNDEIMRAAFALTAAKPLASVVFRQGPKAFVLRYRAVPPKVPARPAAGLPDFDKPEFMQAMMANQKSRDAMRQWVRHLQKSADIDYAPQASAGAVGGEAD